MKTFISVIGVVCALGAQTVIANDPTCNSVPPVPTKVAVNSETTTSVGSKQGPVVINNNVKRTSTIIVNVVNSSHVQVHINIHNNIHNKGCGCNKHGK